MSNQRTPDAEDAAPLPRNEGNVAASPFSETSAAPPANESEALVDDLATAHPYGEGKPGATAGTVAGMRDSASSDEDYANGKNGRLRSGAVNVDALEDTHPTSGHKDGDTEEDHKENPCCFGPLRAIAHFFNLIVPRGGILSGALNLASVTFGAGIMSYPSAFNTAGLAMALIYLVVVTALTVFSIALLAEAAEKTGLMSFESLARGLFGPGADIFVAIIMWLLCFGGATGYVIAVGDIFTSIFQARPALPEFLHTAAGRRCMQAAVWLFFMLPVSMPKYINSLRYVSLVGVGFVIFFVFCVVGYAAQNAFKDGFPDDLVMFRTGNTGISALSIFIFGYLNQVNSITIAREARPRSVKRMTITAALSCGICAVLYFLVGFFGYCQFGASVTGNILLYFDPFAYPIFLVCYIGIIVKLIASFSQNMFACRTALFQVMRWDVPTMPYWKHSIFAGLFATGALILGLFVPDINIVFGFAGAFCGGFIGFIFPSLFIMYSGNWNFTTVGVWRYFLTYFLLIAGVVAVVFGTTSTIYDAVLKYN